MPEVSEFIDDSRTRHSYSANSIHALQYDLSRFKAFLEAKCDILPGCADLTTSHFTKFLLNEYEQGCSPATIKRRQSSLRAFCRYKQGSCPDWTVDPRGISLLPDDPGQAPLHPLPAIAAEEILALRKVLESSKSRHALRDSAIVATIFESGLSVTDLITLDIQDIDLPGGYLLVRRTYGRIFRLNLSEARRPLQRYLEAGRPEFNPPPWEPALFLSQGGSRLSRQALWQSLKRWGAAAGLKGPISPRLLRQAAARNMRDKGHSSKQIQLSLGHTSLLSTLALIERLVSVRYPPLDEVNP